MQEVKDEVGVQDLRLGDLLFNHARGGEALRDYLGKFNPLAEKAGLGEERSNLNLTYSNPGNSVHHLVRYSFSFARCLLEALLRLHLPPCGPRSLFSSFPGGCCPLLSGHTVPAQWAQKPRPHQPGPRPCSRPRPRGAAYTLGLSICASGRACREEGGNFCGR